MVYSTVLFCAHIGVQAKNIPVTFCVQTPLMGSVLVFFFVFLILLLFLASVSWMCLCMKVLLVDCDVSEVINFFCVLFCKNEGFRNACVLMELFCPIMVSPVYTCFIYMPAYLHIPFYHRVYL